MDLFTYADLTSLAEPVSGGPLVSVLMPTQRVVTDAEADPLAWKNLINNVASTLRTDGMARSDVDELLAPAWDLHGDSLAWRHMSDGLVMYLKPGWHQTFRVPVDVPRLATVGDRFLISPLLGAVSGEEHFFVLTVSQRQVRLLEGTRHRVEEVELHDVPTDLREIIEEPESRSDTMARPAADTGVSRRAIFYGHGAGDDTFKKDELIRFFRLVAEGLHPYLADQDHPMVLVGLDELLGAYREVNRYGAVLEQAVDRNPDPLSAGELHEVVWPIVAERFATATQAAVARFGQLHGTGQASLDAAEIETAALEGRVDALLLAPGPTCWQELAGQNPRTIRLGRDSDSTTCEQFDRSVVATLVNGGRVYPVAEGSLFGGGSMAATFRY